MSGVSLAARIVIHPELCSPERLQALAAKLADFDAILEQIGGVLEQETEENFESHGFGSWAPLRRSTLESKWRAGYDSEPLVRSGKLFRALTQRGAPGHKFLVSAGMVAVGVYGDVVPYAAVLADGNSRTGMPGRILVQVRPGTIERILQVISDWLGGSDGVTVYADAPIYR